MNHYIRSSRTMEPTVTADPVPHHCQLPYLHLQHSPSIPQLDSQPSNLHTEHIAAMSPTLSTGSTEIIPIEDSDNEEEVRSKDRPMIRVFLDESRTLENSVAGMRDKQTDRGDPLSDTEDVPQPLTVDRQSSRPGSAELQKLVQDQPGKSHLLDTKLLTA